MLNNLVGLEEAAEAPRKCISVCQCEKDGAGKGMERDGKEYGVSSRASLMAFG